MAEVCTLVLFHLLSTFCWYLCWDCRVNCADAREVHDYYNPCPHAGRGLITAPGVVYRIAGKFDDQNIWRFAPAKVLGGFKFGDG